MLSVDHGGVSVKAWLPYGSTGKGAALDDSSAKTERGVSATRVLGCSWYVLRHGKAPWEVIAEGALITVPCFIEILCREVDSLG